MPVYEYEHLYDECPISGDRFAVIQAVDEPALEYCPGCGLEVKRVVSKVSVVKGHRFSAGKAAEKGFTTWKKCGPGQWEKVDGPGVDGIVAGEDDSSP